MFRMMIKNIPFKVLKLEGYYNFVLKNFERMQGGEIFVPKIPSINITDLATAVDPALEQKIIGIRPGEKLHEVMCPADDSYHTYEYEDHFVIAPTIIFSSRSNDFTVNAIHEQGKQVEAGFEYNSKNNNEFLSQDGLLNFNTLADL